MIVRSIELRNFRCFKKEIYSFSSSHPCTLFLGDNASGKTSLIEAFSFAAFGRSFRTPTVEDIIQKGSTSFFISLVISSSWDDPLEHVIQIGVLKEEKKVTFDGRSVLRQKQILSHFFPFIITADTSFFVQGAVEERRKLLDNFISFIPTFSYPSLLREYNKILVARNSLLKKISPSLSSARPADHEYLVLWSSKLWEVSQRVQGVRERYKLLLEKETAEILEKKWNLEQFEIRITKKRPMHKNFEEFWKSFSASYLEREIILKRSCFGAHLDEVDFFINNQDARRKCSRGIQKCIILSLYIAHREICRREGIKVGPLLIDDLLADLDRENTQVALSILLERSEQVILTSPREFSLGIFENRFQVETMKKN